MTENRDEIAQPVRCARCRTPLETMWVEQMPYTSTRNDPCGCRDGGVLFDFTALTGGSPHD